MKYVLMVSHGQFAKGLLTATNMMTGERDDVFAVCLEDGMSIDDFEVEFNKVISKINNDDEIILLADILSGSPFTKSLEVLSSNDLLNDNAIVFVGMNMPLAVSAILMKDTMELNDLKEALLNEGQSGLLSYEFDNNAKENEEDI